MLTIFSSFFIFRAGTDINHAQKACACLKSLYAAVDFFPRIGYMGLTDNGMGF